MRTITILVSILVTSVIATTARAERAPTRVADGSPYMRPAKNRAKSPDDMAGNWSVRVSTRWSSCPAVSIGSGSSTTWTVAHANGTLTVKSTEGVDLAGSSANAFKGVFKYQLQPKQHPGGGALLVSQFTTDRFSGTMLFGSLGGQARDPVCLVMQDVWATRNP